MRKFSLITVLAIVMSFYAHSQIILRKDTTISIKNIGTVVLPVKTQIFLDSLNNITAFQAPSVIRLGDFIVKPRSKVELYPDGGLKRIILMQDKKFLVNGHQIIAPAQFPVTFHPNGQIDEIYLKHDFRFEQGAFKAQFKAGSYLKFYDNGQLKMGLLKYPVQVMVNNQPVVLKAGRPISFYPDGRFKSGFVWIPVSLIDVHGQKVKIERNRYIQVDKKGKLMR